MIKLVWPSDPKGYINSGFGYRSASSTNGVGSTNHRGVDIKTAGYALAAADGTVTIGGYNRSRGYYLTVNHGGGIVTLYQHLTEGGYLVRNGQTVKAGQRLGRCGKTGKATGVHLHFEVHINGTPVDPEPYLNGATVVSGFGDTSGGGLIASTEASEQAAAVVHIPQVEKVYTRYEPDVYTKKEDRYRITWQSMETGQIREITDRCEAPEMVDDADSLCLELSVTVRQGGADYNMPPLILVPGDFIALTNTASEEVVFVGQVQSVEGSYHSALRCRCLDGGRALTQGQTVIQFNNVPAKDALSQLANKVGIRSILCPELVSSVYGLYQQSPAEILQRILETIQKENGVRYFVRVVGTTLTVRSFGNNPIDLWYRQANNLDSFSVFNEAAEPQLSWAFEEQQLPSAAGTVSTDGTGGAQPDGGTGGTAGQPVSYLQTDPRWKAKDYSAKGEKTTIGGSGCGPTAMAMVLATWADSGVTPETECAWALANGFKCPGSGTYYGYFAAAAKRYGLTCTQLNSGSIYGNAGSSLHQQVLDALAQGDLVIACMGPGTWTRGGHYVLVWKVQGATVYVNDPASTKTERTAGSWATFKSQVKFYWIAKRPGNVPAASGNAETTVSSPTATRMVLAESLTLECYGSDRAVAGALVRLDLAEVQSYFWITAVRHHYGTPHRMTLTLQRSFYEPPDEATAGVTEVTGAVVVSEEMGEALET